MCIRDSYNAEIETLFTFENFGINRGDEMVTNCNEALSMGLEIQGYDSDGDDINNNESRRESFSSTDSHAVFTGLSNILKNYGTFANNGHADDLDNDAVMDQVVSNNNPEAGMSMEFHANHNVSGRKTTRDEMH